MLALCEAHHLAHHDGTLLITRVGDEVTFKFEGRNNFTRTTREVATRKALKARGFNRDQINAIMMRTLHVAGQADLTAEQWLAIALRYESAS